MKDVSLIVWLTQLGLNVALPLAGFVLLALWLRNDCGWGQWVIWVGILLGMVSAVDGLRNSLKVLNRISNKDPDPEPPAVSFNDHD